MAIKTILITARRNPSIATAVIHRGPAGPEGPQGPAGSGLETYADVEALSGYPATFPADHDPVTVTGNGITLTGQQIALSIGTGATQVAAGNHSHALLDSATASATPSTLVLRDSSGNTKVSRLSVTGTAGLFLESTTPGEGVVITSILTGEVTAEIVAGGNFAMTANSHGVPDKLAGSAELTAITESVVALGTVVSSATIDISAGTIVTATLTASTACTFTMPTAAAGKSFLLHLKQAASTGNGTATFTGVVWPGGSAPTVTATAGKMDIISFVSGPNAAGTGYTWYASAVQNLTPP